MKKMLKWSFCILSIVCFVNTCVYHRITHMSDDELEWIANRYEGERMLFKSQYADIDTLTVLEVCICNNLNPINWGHYNTSNKEYIAHAQVRYGFKNRRDGGIMEIWKLFNDKPICFSSVLLDSNWLNEVQLKTSCIKINGVMINDIMLFQTTNKYTNNLPVSYAWSKKYGLVQYTFQDGTTFTRIDIDNIGNVNSGQLSYSAPYIEFADPEFLSPFGLTTGEAGKYGITLLPGQGMSGVNSPNQDVYTLLYLQLVKQKP